MHQDDQALYAYLNQYVAQHPAWSHPLFARLAEAESRDKSRMLDIETLGHFLRNYDAHASHLRRLLLSAATLMPEKAVGYILENVRNEYGNGNVDHRHQLQLQDLAWQIGIDRETYDDRPVQPGVKRFIKDVSWFYHPDRHSYQGRPIKRAAVAAGGITATELMAVVEFKTMQQAFVPHQQAQHIWFDHVTVECEHSEESMALAVYFMRRGAQESVEIGLKGVLDANLHLYDGLLQALNHDTKLKACAI